MRNYDYIKLGLKCGLEIHQQLDTKTKLFCRCPNELQGSREPDFYVKRLMRPVLGEMGKFDEAMLTEYEKGMKIEYECYNDVICTYELDDTPPFECNDEARRIAIEIASLLNAEIIEEMHVCRKNYLDGSVPCGFQRTMILGKDGFVELENGKKIGIDIVCLEEESARKIKTENKTNVYRLDRLGIPLVEVTTNPDINDPLECRECAERLGLLLWASRVKKVLGSIRQDINVSIKSGTRIEIKGVQKLDWIPLLINHEISRQINLLSIKEELKKRKLDPKMVPHNSVELTELIDKKKKNFIATGIKEGKQLVGINLKGFKGLFGKELMPNYRFGTEVSSKVQSISGLKGIIHSDENLTNYSFSESEIQQIKKQLNGAADDLFVLILGDGEEIEKAMKVICDRVRYAFKGVPPETRRALENGNTEFLRELHGGKRLYPDTDLKAIINSSSEVSEIKRFLPELPWKVIKEYSKRFNTEERLIKELIFTGDLNLFEELIEIYPDNPSIILTTLIETTTALRRDGQPIENVTHADYKRMFELLKKGEIGKEAIEEIMIAKSNSVESSIEDILRKLMIESITVGELKNIIDGILKLNVGLIKERKMGAMGPLMGDLMAQVRGKIDGAIVSKELKDALNKMIKGKPP
jgi:glutamyl-tRNA(Gln) amidotransferase subunit E